MLFSACAGVGGLCDGDQTGGYAGGGRGHAPRGAGVHGDSAQQRSPGAEERPHEASAELHPSHDRAGSAAVRSQRYTPLGRESFMIGHPQDLTTQTER